MTDRGAMGDQQSIAALHGRYAAWLANIAARRFGPVDGEEFAQETWSRLLGYSGPLAIVQPKSFLVRVITNVANSAYRRRSTETRIQERFLGANCQPADQVETSTARSIILGLPQPLRDVFVLSRFAGLTNVEIGERLGISPKTVEWRMTKALAHCAAQLRR